MSTAATRSILCFLMIVGLAARLDADDEIAKQIRKLKSTKVTVRREAAKALAEEGPEAKPAVTALTATLKDSDPEVRYYSIAALARIGEDAASAAGEMAKRFDDPVYEIRKLTIEALPRLGAGAVPALVDVIRSDSLRAKTNATVSARGFGDALEPAVDALAECLNHEDWQVRQNAAGSLCQAAKTKSARKCLPKLLELARNDPNHHVRYNALNALYELEGDPDEVIPLAIAALEDPEAYPPMRINAPAGLADYGKKARRATPLLVRLLKSDDHPLLRKSCAEALPVISEQEDDESTLPALREGLKDRFLPVRAGCAQGLYNMRERAIGDAELALEMLKSQPKDKDLAEELRDSNQQLRRNLIGIIGHAGETKADAIPTIVPALADSDPQTRRRAAWAIGRMGKAAVPIRDKILFLAKSDQDREVVGEAVNSLKNIDAAAGE